MCHTGFAVPLRSLPHVDSLVSPCPHAEMSSHFLFDLSVSPILPLFCDQRYEVVRQNGHWKVGLGPSDACVQLSPLCKSFEWPGGTSIHPEVKLAAFWTLCLPNKRWRLSLRPRVACMVGCFGRVLHFPGRIHCPGGQVLCSCTNGGLRPAVAGCVHGCVKSYQCIFPRSCENAKSTGRFLCGPSPPQQSGIRPVFETGVIARCSWAFVC